MLWRVSVWVSALVRRVTRFPEPAKNGKRLLGDVNSAIAANPFPPSGPVVEKMREKSRECMANALRLRRFPWETVAVEKEFSRRTGECMAVEKEFSRCPRECVAVEKGLSRVPSATVAVENEFSRRPSAGITDEKGFSRRPAVCGPIALQS